ncbi:spermine oxidase-like [Cotesia glomerata]|uniref:spermine oxidase-like n=1 Tax=Cotesia glomerata TaxID=32391 RepID=UPI001D007216|nr:spermine oxidase-like [Cotesia glomerata]
MKVLILLLGFISVISSEEISSIIVIIGAGASGVAAASRLLQNGFNNVTILEAEDRIGGRVYSVKIADYLVDLGAEWVHGEKNNVAFELAGPLGLLEKSTENKDFTKFNFRTRLFGSSGEEIPENVAAPLAKALGEVDRSIGDNIDKLKSGSFGEYAEMKFHEYVKDHPEISADKYEPLLHLFDLMQMVLEAGDTWHEISAIGVRDYDECEGDQAINWKERSYTTILDILMKKYPNPEEELPVKNITKLNTKVTEIKYEKTPVKVITANKEEYLADHVIVTPSLGVLQKNIDTLFNPHLTGKKLNAIQNLSFGHVAKIILYYENPWWLDEPVYFRAVYWTAADREEMEKDPEKRWMLGISVGIRVEYRPKLMLFWVTGSYVSEMERTPDNLFQEQMKGFITRFFGKAYNLTEPTIMKRTLWNTNGNFLGTYSFRGVKADTANAHIEDYAEPIMKDDKPVLQFAGEATSSHHSTVHGAIDSGWREADRLINYYKKKSQLQNPQSATMKLLILICLVNCVLSSEEISPRILIIGSGPSGIAAASKLLQNGFRNVTILEAENRIGGRVYSIKIGDYLVDLGAQWVHGENDNVAFELAWPLGLLERLSENKEFHFNLKIYGSDGEEISLNASSSLVEFLMENITSYDSINESLKDLKSDSFGEYAEKKFMEFFKNYEEIPANKYKPLLHFLDMVEMTNEAAPTWYELSAKGARDYPECEGDQAINWKERTYATILDILMKKYPNPEEELPVKNITKLNTKVTEIKYEETPIKVITANKEEYLADHVIVTVSLGVLQKNIDTLFKPQLPEKKLNTIKTLSFGKAAKILIYYDVPWYLNKPIGLWAIYWTEEDRKEIENDPQKRWMLGLSVGYQTEHKPKLFILWVTGPHVNEMETLPEEMFQEQVKDILKRFFGKACNLTEPSIIKRSSWSSNENFLGTWSYRSVQAEVNGIDNKDYAEPIMKDDSPVLQFAGEATAYHYATVNGAIESGWREADRLIKFYNK